MIEWVKLTGDELAGVDRQLPVIVPLGLVEAHGSHLTLGLDIDTADYFARAVARKTGAILAPLIAYGFADAMREYPGTVGVTAETLALVVHDIAEIFCFHGFLKQNLPQRTRGQQAGVRTGLSPGVAALSCLQAGVLELLDRGWAELDPPRRQGRNRDRNGSRVARLHGSRARLEVCETLARRQLALCLPARVRGRQRLAQHSRRERGRANARADHHGTCGQDERGGGRPELITSRQHCSWSLHCQRQAARVWPQPASTAQAAETMRSTDANTTGERPPP